MQQTVHCAPPEHRFLYWGWWRCCSTAGAGCKWLAGSEDSCSCTRGGQGEALPLNVDLNTAFWHVRILEAACWVDIPWFPPPTILPHCTTSDWVNFIFCCIVIVQLAGCPSCPCHWAPWRPQYPPLCSAAVSASTIYLHRPALETHGHRTRSPHSVSRQLTSPATSSDHSTLVVDTACVVTSYMMH